MKTEPEIFTLNNSTLGLYRDAPSWDGKACAAIGNLDIKDQDDGLALVNAAIEQVKSEGFHALLGPMNGDTWHSYRTVLESDGSAPFPLEPTSGPYDLSCLQSAGFEAVSQYMSKRGSLEAALGEHPAAVEGVTVESWDGKNGEAMVDHIFDMSKSSFAKNKFFKPVSQEDFRDIYVPLLSSIDPRFVLLAKTATGVTCGFLFGYPNPSAPESDPTIVLKTYASGLRGVGHALADRFHRNAMDMGFKSVIHALMHEDNISVQRSDRYNAQVFRRYVLLARKL